MNILKQIFLFIVLFVPLLLVGQTIQIKEEQEIDSTNFYYIIRGDTIPREFIDLEEVVLLNKLKFASNENRRKIFNSPS